MKPARTSSLCDTTCASAGASLSVGMNSWLTRATVGDIAGRYTALFGQLSLSPPARSNLRRPLLSSSSRMRRLMPHDAAAEFEQVLVAAAPRRGGPGPASGTAETMGPT